MTYDEKYELYCQKCMARGITPKSKADAFDIPTSKTTEQLAKWITRCEQAGKMRPSPPTVLDSARGVYTYATNQILIVPERTLTCWQAALVHMSACSLELLGTPSLASHIGVTDRFNTVVCTVCAGMPAVQPSHNGGAGKADFGTMQLLLHRSTGLGRLFELRKLDKSSDNQLRSSADVFSFEEGVYVIHAYWFIAEVCGLPREEVEGEQVDHYIVYNAGRRVLYIYPEVPQPFLPT